MFGIIAIFIALGHSVLAMSGEESLAQVYREIEQSQTAELEKGGARYLRLQPGVHLAGFVLRGDDHPRRRSGRTTWKI